MHVVGLLGEEAQICFLVVMLQIQCSVHVYNACVRIDPSMSQT